MAHCIGGDVAFAEDLFYLFLKFSRRSIGLIAVRFLLLHAGAVPFEDFEIGRAVRLYSLAAQENMVEPGRHLIDDVQHAHRSGRIEAAPFQRPRILFFASLKRIVYDIFHAVILPEELGVEQ